MSNVRRATTGGRRAAFVIVLHSMWRRAEGKFALIVLALWLLIAIVSLFWTPQSLWATDGYHVWAKPSAEHWLALTAPARTCSAGCWPAHIPIL